jgi:hypothetical protein
VLSVTIRNGFFVVPSVTSANGCDGILNKIVFGLHDLYMRRAICLRRFDKVHKRFFDVLTLISKIISSEVRK